MIERLKINYFFKTCENCQNQYPKTLQYFKQDYKLCLKCSGDKECFKHEKENEQKKKYLRKRMKKSVDDLSDEYVINLILGKKYNKEIKQKIKKNTELINLKRKQIQLKRIINKWKNTNI